MTRQPRIQRKVEFSDIASREMKTVDDELGIVQGYLNVKNVIDLGGDVSRDGCFKKTISEAYSRKIQQRLDYLWPLCFNHDLSQLPVGGVTDAREDSKGLFITAKINLAIQAGRDLYASLKARTVDRFSMGYKAMQVDWSKHEGKSIRNLLEVAIMEASVVIFPMAPESVVTSIKREGYNNMLLRAKDFNSNYQTAQLGDWQDDFSDVASALQQSILELFTPGRAPLDDFERDVLPGFLDAVRSYIQEGASLGFSNAPSSAAGVYPMMSMSDADIEGKAGYLSAARHAAAKEALAGIEKHTKTLKKALSSLESGGSPARRFNDLAGTPIYSGSSASPSYLTKEEEADITNQLKMINNSLELDNVIREAREDLKDQDPVTQQARRVEEALQALGESKKRR